MFSNKFRKAFFSSFFQFLFYTDKHGYTSLHYTTWDGNDNLVKGLLDAGHDPNVVGLNGATPLHLAASLGRVKTVELLIKKGANIEKRITCSSPIMSNEGDTALLLHLFSNIGQ